MPEDIRNTRFDSATMLNSITANHLDFNNTIACPFGCVTIVVARCFDGIDRIGDHRTSELEVVLRQGAGYQIAFRGRISRCPI